MSEPVHIGPVHIYTGDVVTPTEPAPGSPEAALWVDHHGQRPAIWQHLPGFNRTWRRVIIFHGTPTEAAEQLEALATLLRGEPQ